MASPPRVYFTLPPASFFRFPPIDEPETLPPLYEEGSLRSPFPIDPTFYRDSLKIQVPVTVAAIYFVSKLILNKANRQSNFKPWWISTTRPFYIFQILHNVSLAVFSLVTFIAMMRAIWASFPGWFGEHGFPGAVDALCKINGPRGYGDAVTYDVSTLKWGVKNALIHLDPTGTVPDPTDVGRIWNEGLAFWGWTFYLSKLYEVVDTFIVLMKGKRAITLQTYHHIGAMFAMWAGIRYMSGPILMFVVVNSFIHTLMYTFYTVTTMGYRVPVIIKRNITRLQIAQLVFGLSWASSHLFVSYDVPVSKPYSIASVLSNASTASEFLTDATQMARSTGPFPAWAKRLLYRAAGAEGLAQSVRESSIYTDRRAAAARKNNIFGNEQCPAPDNHYFGTTSYETIPCLDTTGQAFACWLNVIYLLPLIVLFLRFFFKSYRRRASMAAGDVPILEQRRVSASLSEAVRRTSVAVESLGVDGEDSFNISDDMLPSAKANHAASLIKQSILEATGETSTTIENMGIQGEDSFNAVSKEVSDAAEAIKTTVVEVKENIENSSVVEKASQVVEEVKSSSTVENLQQSTVKAKEYVTENATFVANAVTESETLKTVNEKLEESRESLGESYVKVTSEAQEGLKVMTGAKDSGEVMEEQESRQSAKSASSSSSRKSSIPRKITKKNNSNKSGTTSPTTNGASHSETQSPTSANDEILNQPTSRTSINEDLKVDYKGKITEDDAEKDVSTSHPASYADAVKEDLPSEETSTSINETSTETSAEDQTKTETSTETPTEETENKEILNSPSGGFGLHDD